jgi:anthranilate synthase component 1
MIKKNYRLQTRFRQILADTVTPVSAYLRLRDKFANSLLLESSDYHAGNNSFSYICCNPVAYIKVENELITKSFPDGSEQTIRIDTSINVIEEIRLFSEAFETGKTGFKFIHSGLFGYIAYDAVRYFETVNISKKAGDPGIPDLYYAVYQNIIAINHFKNEAFVFCHSISGEDNCEDIIRLLQNSALPKYSFTKNGLKESNLTDTQFIANVKTAKQHCFVGNVFQLVLSRRFSQAFKGDEFNVYRALRNINPSPYLFFFDYGNFRIFGSSPEAQLVVKDRRCEIHPIAGTFRRTGNDEQDAQLARELASDKKENSEHVMLVDLARNDLSRNAVEVTVDTFGELQFFSHVIHLVSKVSGKLRETTHPLQAVADTFPAGTLSGAPKFKAMQLIEEIENTNRNFYGGAIGFMDFEGNFNHAIMIRTFLSKGHELHYQAGAGITAASNEENELQEVYNKLAALDKAIELAQQI